MCVDRGVPAANDINLEGNLRSEAVKERRGSRVVIFQYFAKGCGIRSLPGCTACAVVDGRHHRTRLLAIANNNNYIACSANGG